MPAPSIFSPRFRVPFVVVICSLLFQTVATAQDKQYTENKPDLAMRSDARIDPSTLAMSLEIPLAGAPGRAGTNLPVALRYSSKVWRINHSMSWWSYFNYNTWTRGKFSENSTAGWTSSLERPRIEFTGMNQLFDSEEGNPLNEDPDNPSYYGCYVRRLNVHLPDGSSHELRKDDTPQCFYLDQVNYDFTGAFYAVDGSNMRYDNDAGVLYMPDGGRYFFGSMQVQNGLDGRWATSYIDRNGNTLTYNPTTKGWTDTLGRSYSQVLPDDPTVDYPNGGYQYYSVPGFNGQQLTYTLYWTRLADVLSNPAEQLRYTSNWDCLTPQSYQEISPYLFFSSYPSRICADGAENPVLFNPVVLAEVQLPNGQQYQLRYNPWGEIDKVVFPTGGYERYRYDKVATIGDITEPYDEGNRGVVERWASPSGNGSEESTHHWQYSITGTGGSRTATTTMPDGTRSERSVYVSSTADYGFDNPLAGMAHEERIFNSGNQMLRRTLTEWSLITPPGSSRPRNPHVTKNINLILDTGGDALASTTTFQHDADLNTTVTSKFDFASVNQAAAQTWTMSLIPSGDLVRTEEATYLVNDTNIDSTTRTDYRARNLLSLVTSARVKNADTIVAQSSVSYDEAAYPLLTYGAVTGWTDPATTVRGNATSSASWVNTTGAWLQTHAQYDQAGSARNSWDAKGNQSQVEYSSEYAYAYPTLTRSAVPDASGQHGSNAAFVSTTVYDFNTGLATSATNANNQTTTLEYNDNLYRLTKINLPDGGYKINTYVDTHPCGAYVETKTLLEAAGREAKSWQFFDGLGRPYLSESLDNQDPNNPYFRVDTQYDSMGRAWRSSNPYRTAGCTSTMNPSGQWTTTAFDAFSRTVSVTTPDNAVVSTSYSGATVTVTDPNGKQRKSVTDGLGRLKEVYEDPAGLNYLTSYSYDVLDNLTTVSQGVQTRYFMYDSLKRLMRARNPEQDTNASLNLSDPLTGNSQWSIGYQYDNNGNLTQKTDALGVSISYTYDALNRNTTTNYSNTTIGNPDVPDITRVYDGAVKGKGQFWYSYAGGNYTAGSNVEHTAIDSYDALGRPLIQRQLFKLNGVWGDSARTYQTERTYDLAGHVKSQKYPSQRTVTYNYDQAGRLGDKDAHNLAFFGNLGDGVTRTYSSGIVYSSLGGMTREQFGTDTALYNKTIYNSRGQAAEIRVGTYHATDNTWWNRGAIINHYSDSCWGSCGGTSSTTPMTDNNGNLKKQEVYIPTNEQAPDQNHTTWWQQYNYDALNRLDWVREISSGAEVWKQNFSYDRYGNRTIHQTNTWGTGINKKDFTVNTGNNRLGVPSGQGGEMIYDAAGNLTRDTYSGGGYTRAYDAENRMTSETQAGNYLAGVYTYNADGQRVRRAVGGQPSAVTTWQVYGMDGELLAEYAQNGVAASPQKEYGYRNGQLLITAEAPSRINVARASNGGTVTAQNFTQDGVYPGSHFYPSSAIDGQRYGHLLPGGGDIDGMWRDEHGLATWLQVDFNGSKTIDEVNVFTCADYPAMLTQADPSATQTFTSYGATSFTVQYWTGSAWATVPGGTVTGNNLVWKKINFAALTTTKIRVMVNAAVDGVARIVEVEAWGTADPPPAPTNVARASNGGTVTAQNFTQDGVYPGSHFYPSSAIDGQRYGHLLPGGADIDGLWRDEHGLATWLQVDFNGSKTIDEVDVFTCADHPAMLTQTDPAATQTFTSYGATSFTVQYWTGSAWATVPGGTVTGNNLVWRKINFAALTTTKIRVMVNAAVDGVARIVEVEAWGTPSVLGSTVASINWLVADQLGTPRMVFDQTGALATTKRHDYLPFGEELFATQGARTTALGYTGDNLRQKFTSYERDTETNLDFAQARYYANTQGRFTSVDPLMASAEILNPQSLNRYSYALNSPSNNTDPSGMLSTNNTSAMGQFARNYASGYWSDDSAEPLGGVGYARSPSELMPAPSAAGGGGIHEAGHSPQNTSTSVYEVCRELIFGPGDWFMGKNIPDEGMTNLLLAAGGTINDSAFAASLVAKESNFTWRPDKDHGPAQLTSWWKNNHPDLIIDGSYDPFSRPDSGPNAKNRDRKFTGSPTNNIMTLGNIVRFQRKHHAGNEYLMAKTYYSGPGDQDAYAKEVLGRYKAYKPFFKCLGAR